MNMPPGWTSYPPQSSGFDAGDLRERVRALEVEIQVAEKATDHLTRRMDGTDRRLDGIDQRASVQGLRIAAVEATARDHAQRISEASSEISGLSSWRDKRDAETAERERSKQDRTAARKEALAMAQWIGAFLLIALYAMGAIGADRIDGLLKLRGLLP